MYKVRKQGKDFSTENTKAEFWHEIIDKSLIPTFGWLMISVG